MTTSKCQYGLTNRQAGVLLHPTSLPGEGSLGPEAINLLDFLSAAGISVWQMLPVGPTHADGSPYQGLSVHAGNPDLISLQWLVDEALLDAGFDGGRTEALASCCRRFFESSSAESKLPWYRFLEEHAIWLDDYALFCAIRSDQSNKGWWEWPTELRIRDSGALERCHERLAVEIRQIQFEQFVFYRQWHRVKEEARNRKIELFGDLPIFVAHDSADVWQHQDLFKLDESGQPTVVAGVPPDYFSATGQRWGNPLYDWTALRESGYAWWVDRIRSAFDLFDIVRIDHFRGFQSHWEIPAQCETAIDGVWVPGPGEELFQRLSAELGSLPLIAEDLGLITEDVLQLRDRLGLPGMKILQFAFDGNNDNPYLPHNHVPNSVVYTGTHDNDTTMGWLDSLDKTTKAYLDEYLGHPQELMPWPLIRAALASVADLSVVPMQDLLGLSAEHRMNTPGTTEGNWDWRFEWAQVPEHLPARIRGLLGLYQRV